MAETYPHSGILVEAEAFDDYGGWVLDSQFELEMGSPYLLAHGNGKPVADAATTISIPQGDQGRYNVWVRAKDWVPDYHPGRFNLIVNGTSLAAEFGTNDQDWNWQFGGKVALPAGKTHLKLRDLTGFCGRCDAIFFSRGTTPPPNDVNELTRAWRRKFLGLPDQPTDAGHFDVVVVGGGVVGAVAAIVAARLGGRVALVQNRPVLGGNASVEVGLRARGVRGPLVEELSDRHPNGDLKAQSILEAEPNATLFMEYTVYNATADDSTIRSIDARHGRTSKEIRLTASNFIDCSGRAVLGLLTNADTLFGQEARAEYGESLAPLSRDTMHHGNTVFFRTTMASSPAPFPSVPWATSVAKDYSDLGGQLMRPGFENGPGPKVVPPNFVEDPTLRRRMKNPATHFWEYGQWLDPYKSGEQVRDHLLRAIYGTFSNVKTMEPDKYANLELDWVAFVAATGEFRRYKGDHVLSEGEIRNHRAFHDGVVQNDGAFCLHYPSMGPDPDAPPPPDAHPARKAYTFRLQDWGWDERDRQAYTVPLRCLYSKSISNLLVAGKHVSATHVAVSNMKFMGNGAQHAIAAAVAAHICQRHNTTPRGIVGREEWIQEVKNGCEEFTKEKDSEEDGSVKSRL